jgi:hypothetical protein
MRDQSVEAQNFQNSHGATMFSKARKYHAYACECLQLAEKSVQSDIRERFIEIARLWLKAALHEERKTLKRLEGLNHIGSAKPELDGSNKIAS